MLIFVEFVFVNYVFLKYFVEEILGIDDHFYFANLMKNLRKSSRIS